MTLRILAGDLKGRSLQLPADATALRPTSARRREAAFDILRGQFGSFAGLRLADLFAGSGAVGIEALSQGFAEAVFVEQDAAAVRLIRRNLEALGLERRGRVVAGDAARLAKAPGVMDVVFLDPPYHQGLAAACLKRLGPRGWLGAETVVLVEVGKGETLAVPDGLEIAREHPHGAGRLVRLAPA